MIKKMTTVLLGCWSVLQASTVVNVLDLTEEQIQNQLSNLTIEFSENTHLPLSLIMSGDLFSVSDHAEFEVKQKFYVQFVGQDFLFSTDLVEWKPFTQFATGHIGIALSHMGYPSLSINGETNLR